MESWHALAPEKVIAKLESRFDGLTLDEVKKKHKQYGSNKLPKGKKLSPLLLFLRQLKSPLVYILLVAALLTFVLSEYVDMTVILLAVFVNVSIGFFQDYKAENTLEKLKSLVVEKAKVIRDGSKHEISGEDVVPGDIIFFEAGDKIPADARLINIKSLQVNESALTGESTASLKNTESVATGVTLADRESMVYMGTVVEAGRGIAIVTTTGSKTELGEIAQLVQSTSQPETPLQKRLQSFSQSIGFLLLLLTIIILLIGVLLGRELFEMVLVAIALAVAAIPEGLPASVTIILAIGTQRILQKKGLVRQLVSAETLGSASVICTDKTGTLTQGVMHVDSIQTVHAKTQLESLLKTDDKTQMNSQMFALEIGMICNDSVVENPKEKLQDLRIFGDSTDRAFMKAGIQAGIHPEELEKNNVRIDDIPFSSKTKFMATLNHQEGGDCLILTKGAPEMVMEFCSSYQDRDSVKSFTREKRDELTKVYKKMTAKGLRVLAVAYKTLPCRIDHLNSNELVEMNFVAFVGLKDPLRSTAKDTLDLTRKAGVRPILITGDHKLTARAIFEESGVKVEEKNIIEGYELEKMSADDLQKKLTQFKIYARVEPKHKMQIIEAWQRRGDVVAMTGDGVNDAPALKAADIGVALGSGTEVAKEASDIVLLNDNLKTLVLAIKQGRIMFDNIRKVIVYNLASSFSEVLLVVGSLLFGMPLPLLPAQILWINIVQDALPSMSLAFEKGEKGVMSDKPRKKNEPLLNSEMKFLIFAIGIVTDIILFLFFAHLYLNSGFALEKIQTIIFVSLGISSLFYVFSLKQFRNSIFKTNIFSNPWLVLSVAFGGLMVLVGVYVPTFQSLLRTVPLTLQEWYMPLLLAVVQLSLFEITKWIFNKNTRLKK